MKFSDTIYSLVTAPINQNVAIVRISGDKAFDIPPLIAKFKKDDLVGGRVYNKDITINNELLDNVLFLFFKGPRSFTGEDVVEIQTHGSLFVISKIAKFLELNGLRQAEPGDFSRRSFLNDKMDLVQAESINNLILSKTRKSQEVSSAQLLGKSSSLINELRESILTLIAEIEVAIDYPEFEETKQTNENSVKNNLKDLLKKIKKIYKDSSIMTSVNDGFKIAIVGKPNVGKSSILNSLLKEDKAIVYDMPGTTRDVVEGEFYLDGLLYKLIDTAGIRKAGSKIEELGIEKSLKKINEADIIISVFDSSKKLSKEDKFVLDSVKDKNNIIVLNKKDLTRRIEIDAKDTIEISAKSGNLDKLVKEIVKRTKKINVPTSNDVLLGERQLSLLEKSINSLDEIISTIDNSLSVDLISEDIKEVYSILSEILGEKVDGNLLDKIFSKFCLGK